MTLPMHEQKALKKARALIEKAAASRKCLACGCFHQMLTILEQAAADRSLLNGLSEARQKAKSRLVEQQYDCFGCKVCYPPLVFNSLSLALGEDFAELEVCPGRASGGAPRLAASAGKLSGTSVSGSGGRLHPYGRRLSSCGGRSI